MKKLFLTFFVMCASIIVFAQKFSPEIKEGTILSCSAYVQGQEIPLMLSIKNASVPFVMAWSVDGYGDGTFEMTENAIKKGDKLFSPTQPSLGATILADDETFGILSKSAYQLLVNNKEITLNGINFKIKSTPTAMTISGKEVDATHLIGAEGKLEIWVLNNEKFPLILQTSGMSTDIVVVDIK